MLNWNEIVQKYIIKYSNRIAKATRPLRDHFGVCYFTYHHIDHEGQYTVLVDRPDWAEYYVAEKFFANDPYLRHPSNYSPGISLIGHHGSEEYKEKILKAGAELFQMDHSAMLIQKDETGVEFFGFAANRNNSCLEKIYLNHQSLLIKYAAYFKKELGDILLKMQEEAGNLRQLKGQDFFTKELITPEPSSQEAFLEEIGLKADIERAAKLSSREKECMRYLVNGLCTKEIAAHLKLSPRTVEFYLENIKNKLSCWSKHELSTIARSLADLNLL